LSAFEIEFQVVESYAADIKPGMAADITLGGRSIPGTVTAISPEVRQNEVTGRVKDVIHRGGETVAAGDLEEHLRAHPAISSAAAVALPDPYLGEKICAAVVFTDGPVTLTELNDYLSQRGVATHARPDVLAEMASLPTTPVGKIDKKEIARQLQA